MNGRSRCLMAAAALLLLGSFLLPIWQICLTAPQYPEGLRMVIWLTHLAGGQPSDLYNINLLNHYIGMGKISQHMPELAIMPVVVIALAVFGLIAAAIGKRGGAALWLVTLTVAGIIGFADFYRWEYTYGHNLDPSAPIKVPGMVYQPPVIGSKRLLNITASSYPGAGAVFPFLSALLSLLAVLQGKDESSKTRERPQGRPSAQVLPTCVALAAICAASVSACQVNRTPAPINYGRDACAHCGMEIMDARYSSELVTEKGRTVVFDSVGCAVQYLKSHGWPEHPAVFVSDFADPANQIAAQNAVYLVKPDGSGPMGAPVAAFRSFTAVSKYCGKRDRIEQWLQICHDQKSPCVSSLP